MHPLSKRLPQVPTRFHREQVAEYHILGGYSLQRLANDRDSEPRGDKGEHASGAVRFLDNSWLEIRAPANFQEPIAVIRVHTI